MAKDRNLEVLTRLQNLAVKITKMIIIKGSSKTHIEREQLKGSLAPTPFKSKEYNQELI